jgi:hypothetical protein
MKKIVSLSFRKYGEADLAQFATNIVNRMKADAQFSTLMTYVDGLSVCDTAFDLAVSNALDGGSLLVKEKNRKMAELKDQLEVVAIQVEGLAKEDEDVVLAAGFKLKRASEPINDVSEPTGLKVVKGDKPGSIKVTWEAVPGAINYGIETRLAGETQWRNGDYSSARSTVLTGFDLGAHVYIQVRTYGRKGLVSGWSQEIDAWIS